GPIWIYLATPARLAIYAPVLVGGIAGWRRSKMLSASMAGGAALYTFVTGAAHTGRYLIWIFALLIVLATVEASTLSARVLAPSLAWLLTVCVGEAYLRGVLVDTGRYRISEIVHAPDTRKERTDALLSEILDGGCHPASPAVALM